MFVRVLLFAVSTLAGACASAATVGHLHQASVPVESRGERERTEAVKAALAQVMIKVTGDRHASEREGAGDVLSQASRLMQQYQFYEAPAAPEAPALQLRVRFDPEALGQALRAAGLPVWGKERPAVLVWLSVDDGAGRHLVGADDETGVAAALEQQARRRGVPVVLPLLDLEDAANLRRGSGHAERLAAASERYGADAILSGHARRVLPGLWESDWMLYGDGRRTGWSARAPVLELLVEEGVDALADALAARFARAGEAGGTGTVALTVQGVYAVDDYARVLRYLRSLDAVSAVEVERVEPTRLHLRAQIRGGARALAQTAALGETLRPLETAEGAVYRLLPR